MCELQWPSTAKVWLLIAGAALGPLFLLLTLPEPTAFAQVSLVSLD
ncbi:hypothetical protein J3B00_002430 [Pseudomonas sp. BP8]|nr:hypothetical protein [Pseudomonas sp. BP8]